jgi:hypothetical protein
MSSTTVATGTDAPRQPSGTAGRRSGAGFLAGPVGRNLGLVVALAVLCIVGTATAPTGSSPSTTCSPSCGWPP